MSEKVPGMKKLLLAATCFSTVLSGAALAADLPSRKAPPAVYAPVPVFSWTGFYVGANVGYGWMDAFNKGVVFAPFGLADPHGGIVGGAQIGYNWQVSPMFVVGVETDFQGSSVGGGITARKTPWFGTVRGRLGVTPFGAPVMLYATGGFAYGRLNIGPNFPTGVSVGKVATGWTAGAGVEYAFTPNWSVKGEYLFTNIGANYPLGVFGSDITQRVHDHTVRVGLNYRFGWGGGPVVAKY
ncbi:MAG: porin family protein [Rhodoblastus sp.]